MSGLYVCVWMNLLVWYGMHDGNDLVYWHSDSFYRRSERARWWPDPPIGVDRGSAVIETVEP